MKKTILALLLLVPLFLTGCSLNDIMSGLVNQVPEAVIDASPLQGHAPLTVNFDAHYSHDDKAITNYYWNFGDPHDTVPLSSIEATHTYTPPSNPRAAIAVPPSGLREVCHSPFPSLIGWRLAHRSSTAPLR